jgi:hypothetical protein
MLGLSRVESEDFLGRHDVPLAVIGEVDLTGRQHYSRRANDKA